MTKRCGVTANQIFGDWIVLKDEGKVDAHHQAVALFQCQRCGRTAERRISSVKRNSRCKHCYLTIDRRKSIKKLSIFTKRQRGLPLTSFELTKLKRYDSERINAYNKRMRLTNEGRSNQLYYGAQQRAKAEKVPFKLTKTWILEKLKRGCCEVTNIPFDYTSPGFNKVNKYAPSLDRLKKEAGYTKENVTLVVWIYNTAKNAFSHDDLLLFTRKLVERFPTT